MWKSVKQERSKEITSCAFCVIVEILNACRINLSLKIEICIRNH